MSELYQRAVRLLARREHTRAELVRKLAAFGDAVDIEALLNQLAGSGLQSDQRFAESYLRSQANRLGSARLRQALRQKGVAAELIADQIGQLPEHFPDELTRARSVWQRKFSAPPADAREWARQARFLQGRGFAVDVIRQMMNGALKGELEDQLGDAP